MMKHVLSGAMALALLAGVSHAQDTSVTRQSTVVQEPDGDRAVHSRTTVNRDTPYGDQSVTKNTVRRTDEDGDTSTTRRTTRTNETPYGDTRSTTVQRSTTDPDR
jgi:hypothetical protein